MQYLDANATEPLRPEARAAVLAALEVTGNPSSVHARRARGAPRAGGCARTPSPPASAAGRPTWCSPPAGPRPTRWRSMRSARGRRVIVGATEHDAVRAAAAGRRGAAGGPATASPTSTRWPRCWRTGRPALVCLMLANNETGTLQPVAEAAALCRRHGALLHVDAVQAAGRIPVDLRGARRAQPGAVVAQAGRADRAPARCCWRPRSRRSAPLIAGGGQERGRRGGTPPLPAIAGFAAAAPSAACRRTGRRCAMRSSRPRWPRGAVVCGGRRAAAAPTPPASRCPACGPTRR